MVFSVLTKNQGGQKSRHQCNLLIIKGELGFDFEDAKVDKKVYSSANVLIIKCFW